jgi:hypothetical protein
MRLMKDAWKNWFHIYSQDMAHVKDALGGVPDENKKGCYSPAQA